VETDSVPEGRLTYSTGGAFFLELKARELPWELMPASFQASYRHYGSMGWVPHVDKRELPWRFRLAKARDRWILRLRLQLARLRDRIQPVEIEADPAN
jgi:hypothetical protein